MATRLVLRTSPRLCDSLRFSASDLRFYSTQPTDHVASEDVATSHEDSRAEDARKRRNNYARQWQTRKRADDPEFRAKQNQRIKEWFLRKSAADPEFRAQQIQITKEWFTRKLATDSEWALAYRQKCLSRYYDPETHETMKDMRRQYQRSQRAGDPTYKLKDYARHWVMKYRWVRDDLNWSPWTPILYPEKVEHRCQECGRARHDGAKLWWKLEQTEGFTCHSCFFKQSNGGLPKGYEGCTTLKEIRARKKALETQPLQVSTAQGLTGQSWKPPKTSSPISRSFSTFRAVWTSLSEKTDIKELAAQVPQPQALAKDDPGVVEAKRQYQLARQTWKLAKDMDPKILETSAAYMREAKLKYNRIRYAWNMANGPGFAARRRKHNHKPGPREVRARYRERPESRANKILWSQSRRANDPLFNLKERVYQWMARYPMARKMVNWPTHRPVLYSEPVEHFCQECSFTRVGGLRLWWRSVSNTDMYNCHRCFMKSEDGGLPEAYKDCTSLRELSNRFQQLEGVRPKYEPHKSDIEVEQKNTKALSSNTASRQKDSFA